MTDSSSRYNELKRSKYFAMFNQVNQSAGEYVWGQISTNTVESFFSILKRGLNGIYHGVSAKHLHRYLAEYDFRYCHRDLTDGQSTSLAIKSANGKRLTYRQSEVSHGANSTPHNTHSMTGLTKRYAGDRIRTCKGSEGRSGLPRTCSRRLPKPLCLPISPHPRCLAGGPKR
jgi:ISXO2-like transposase domain